MRKLLGTRFTFLNQDEALSDPMPRGRRSPVSYQKVENPLMSERVSYQFRDIEAVSQEIQREKLLYLL